MYDFLPAIPFAFRVQSLIGWWKKQVTKEDRGGGVSAQTQMNGAH